MVRAVVVGAGGVPWVQAALGVLPRVTSSSDHVGRSDHGDTRNPFFHLKPSEGMFYRKWTIDDGGHFDLKMGDKYAAEMVYNFMTRGAEAREDV